MQDKPIKSPPEAAGSAIPAGSAPSNLPSKPPLANHPETDHSPDEAAASPAWADDLRQLYNAVVEEPLPDSLIDLLSQLDSKD